MAIDKHYPRPRYEAAAPPAVGAAPSFARRGTPGDAVRPSSDIQRAERQMRHDHMRAATRHGGVLATTSDLGDAMVGVALIGCTLLIALIGAVKLFQFDPPAAVGLICMIVVMAIGLTWIGHYRPHRLRARALAGWFPRPLREGLTAGAVVFGMCGVGIGMYWGLAGGTPPLHLAIALAGAAVLALPVGIWRGLHVWRSARRANERRIAARASGTARTGQVHGQGL
ncbi:MAG: hypothetical protein AB7K09_09440 [Planctomycetota bacterium]